MASIKNAYATKATITVTLASLTNGSAREATVISNASNLYADALLRCKMKGQASGTGVVSVWAYAALGDSSGYTDGATGSDAAFTAANILNAAFVGNIQMNQTTAVVGGPLSIAAAFGGVLPAEWGLIFKNESGATLSATSGDFVIEYQGVYQTVA